jgi:hypothetical protein
MPHRYSIEALYGPEVRRLLEDSEALREYGTFMNVTLPPWCREVGEQLMSPGAQETVAQLRTALSGLGYWDPLQRHESPPLQQQRDEAPPLSQQRKGRPKGRRSRIIAHSDEAIQQMIHERANKPRSLRDEVCWIVKFLNEHGFKKIDFDNDGRCKVLERRINEAWKAASRA